MSDAKVDEFDPGVGDVLIKQHDVLWLRHKQTFQNADNNTIQMFFCFFLRHQTVYFSNDGNLLDVFTDVPMTQNSLSSYTLSDESECSNRSLKEYVKSRWNFSLQCQPGFSFPRLHPTHLQVKMSDAFGV